LENSDLQYKQVIFTAEYARRGQSHS